MVRKKIDNRIRNLIENCVVLHHRSMFVVVGGKARDSVVILHEMLSKAEVKARPTVLWCYKKDLGFSTNKRKQKRLKKAIVAETKQNVDKNDSLEYFIASTTIRYCYYSETNSILGQTFGMAILQDFEALTPNLLARTIETVEGGGMVLILLQTLTSLKQLYTMAMDVHTRYRTEAHQNVVCRFNERFILSLSTCSDCLVLDDQLNIIPISSSTYNIKSVPNKSWDMPKSEEEQALLDLKASLDMSQPSNVLIKMCKTIDQANAVTKFVESLTEMTLSSTVTLTSARGRGKSAALGLAVAAAICFKYTNIIVTSPHPENLKTFFEFVLNGLDALGYEKATDYEEVRSMLPEYNKAIVQVNIMRNHKQTVKYIQPSDNLKLEFLELLVVDEAAAIPLSFVKALMGPYLIFLSSTINGYEGTGRSLSLKLINQLRKQSNEKSDAIESQKLRSKHGRNLHELVLNESIRYSKGDQVEDWLNRVLCLDVIIPTLTSSENIPLRQCKLYYVNRDTLFSYNKFAERFLRKIMAILVSSHYKNSPNDLLMMSDAPAHHIFCLCAPSKKTLPEVMCVLQVCFEGKLSQNTVKEELSRGRRGAGDLIPWTISQEFLEQDFPSLSGARVLRIATHPDHQGKGYGLLSLKLLQEFYEGKHNTSESLPIKEISSVIDETMDIEEDGLEEKLMPRTSLPPLLLELSQVKASILDYLGVSYGVTAELLRFWKKAGFSPVYLAYSPNQLTGEHSCIMLKQLCGASTNSNWLPSFWFDFCEKMVQTVSFLKIDAQLALSLLTLKEFSGEEFPRLTKFGLSNYFNSEDMDIIKSYYDDPDFGNPANYIIQQLCVFYFSHRIGQIHLTDVQEIILLSHGILHTSLLSIAESLNLSQSKVDQEFDSAFKTVVSHIVNL